MLRIFRDDGSFFPVIPESSAAQSSESRRRRDIRGSSIIHQNIRNPEIYSLDILLRLIPGRK